MKFLILTKKGNLDSIIILAGLFVISAVVISLVGVFSSVSLSGAFASSSYATNILTGGTGFLNNVGNEGFGFIAFGLILFNVIASYLLVTHPIFALVDLFVFPITWYTSAILSNAYETSLYTLPAAAGLTTMNFIMLNLLTIIVAADILTAIVTYAVNKE